ncbi:hypothetical protein Aph02nite_22820 [Actinoplanes philippinensis]|nr:hypothetical protein Aph02nite_22820 [Actinoplanes philippinensis]
MAITPTYARRRPIGPHDRHESGKNDRTGAVAREEVPCPIQVLLLEQARVGPPEQRRPDAPPEQMADLVRSDPT